MKPVLIIFNGPAASGKSTIAEQLQKKLVRTSLINLDKIKWLISDYKSDSFDLNLASEVSLEMTKVYLSNNITVIIEKAFCKKEFILIFLNYVQKKKIRVLIYNLEAPWKVIQKRLESRKQEMAQEKGKKIYDNYSNNKFKVNQTFDTSKLSIQEIINSIKSDILNKS